MAEWKKLIVSGGVAELAGITSSILTDNNILVAGPEGGIENSGLTYDGSTLALGSSTLTNTSNNASLSGSFSGSFFGDGSGLSGVAASFPSTQKVPITGTTQVFVNDGASKYATVSQFTSASYFGLSGDITATDAGVVTIADDAVDNNKLANMTQGTIKVGGASNAPTDLDAKTDGYILIGDGTDINSVAVSGDVTINNAGTTTIATSLGTLGTNNFTGSFTGSFTGDGSGLTGLATTLTVGSDTGGTTTVDLTSETLDIAGGTNITTATTAQTVTVNLDSTITGDITFSGDTITIQKDLVVQGTASFQETENLRIADRFILLASGSTSAGDGGLVVQQDTGDTGELFGFDSGTSRWAVTSSFHASQSAFTPLAYMPLVINADANDVAAYQKDGNIKISDDGDIYIYVE